MKILSSIAFDAYDPNAFVNEYWRHVSSRHELKPFSWAKALFSRYDVLHVQWPEYLVAGRGPRGALRSILPLALFIRARLQRIPVVQTIHNQAAHDGSSVRDTFLLRLLDGATVGRIYLNESAENRLDDGAVILHGSYEAPTDDPVERVRDRIAVVGGIRRYKGLEKLVEAMSLIDAPDASLHIAGAPSDKVYASELEALVVGAPRVHLDMRLLSDSDLWRIVRAASLVALPYTTFYNSGVAILALSAGRRVLLPRTPSSQSLVAELGGDWVRLFDHPLSAEDLSAALDTPLPSVPPDLSRRRWADAGELYDQVLQAAVQARRTHSSMSAARRAFRALVSDSHALRRHSTLNAGPPLTGQLRDRSPIAPRCRRRANPSGLSS